MHRKALGRGLDALIPAASGTTTMDVPGGVRELPLSDINPNPFQPRARFDDEAIRELAESIKATGILQPIIVRSQAPAGYQLVAGERRLRAAGLAGLSRIPALIRTVEDREMLEMALIENVQREDLNPIEEAKAYRALAEGAGLTHDRISERVGKKRVSITNSLRLLELPPEVQDMVSRETLSSGHARALLSLNSPGDQLAAARYIQTRGFSVRRTEAYVRRKLHRLHSRGASARPHGHTEWETKLQQRFGTFVSIVPKRKGGKIEFQYFDQSDLERLLEAWQVM